MSQFILRKTSSGIPGPLLLVILDGVGLYKGASDGYPGNALDLARAPRLKSLLANAPLRTSLQAHGRAVGMPSDADMGNSEVGHNAMGAGRIFDQGAKLVAQSIASGELFRGEAWRKLIGTSAQPGLALSGGRAVHFIGLLSDGNVHSHIEHLFAMIDQCAESGVERLFVHALLDGRDVDRRSAHTYVERLEGKLNAFGKNYAIASGGGRMKVTMDRYEADWGMVELGWKTHVRGEGRFFPSASEAVRVLREELGDITDQDLPPFVIARDGSPVGPVRDDDIVIFFNFRGDRAIEISRAFTEENFDVFRREPPVRVHYAGMMQYDGDLKIPPEYLVAPPAIDRTLSEYLVKNGVSQYAISETQKFGHVTYFWNGNNSSKFDEQLEEWKEIPSLDVPFDEAPEMKAVQITDALIGALREGRHKFLRVNYANGDMVGHTGILPAAVAAVEALDRSLERLLACAEETGATVIITADHGNCDCMIETDKNGEARKDSDGNYLVKTSHTLSPVPFLLTGAHAESYRLNSGSFGLGNLAATVLALLGFEAPDGYMPSIVADKE